jgi:hypothetical protein
VSLWLVWSRATGASIASATDPDRNDRHVALGGGRLGLRRPYINSDERTTATDGWLFRYNHYRDNSAIGRKPPRRPT